MSERDKEGKEEQGSKGKATSPVMEERVWRTRNISSKTLLQYLADALFEGSERKQQREGWDMFDAVIETAVELGLVMAR